MSLRIVGIMALGMSLGVSAYAGRGIDRATGQAIWDAAVNGRTTTIGRGNNSMLVIRPTTQGTPVAVAGGGARVTDTIPVPVGGTTVPVAVQTNVAKDAIVGGIVGVVTGGVVGGVIGVAMPLTQAYLDKGGVRVNPQTGQAEVNKNAGCTGTVCTRYSVPYQGWEVFGWSAAAACSATIGMSINVQGQVVTVTGAAVFGSVCGFGYKLPSGTEVAPGVGDGVGIAQQDGFPAPSPTWYPATSQEVRDSLYKNDPPPAIIDELSRYGNIIWPGPASVSGPASVTGPKETTVSTIGNQTTTTVAQTSTPVTYNSSTGTATSGNPTRTTTTTTVTTNPDGSTSTSTGTSTTTTATGTEAPAQTPEEAAPSDTPLPAVPELYTRKYPNGMEGIWTDYKDQLKGTSLVSLVGKLMPNVGNGGSCPSWMLNLDLAHWATFGTHDVAPPCWIWDVAKAILVLSALLLARSLIFGG